jgi:hypothetical protein
MFDFPDYDRINAATASAAAERATQQHGQDILKMFTGGAGLGMGGMALYHLAHALRGSTRKERKAQKYQNLAAGAPVAPVAKAASDDGIAAALGKAPEQLTNAVSGLIGLVGGGANKDPNILRGSLATTLGYAAGLGGLYGGGKLVNSIMDKKRKADAEDAVEEARQNYYAALSGKAAAALDKAYERYEKTAIVGEILDPTLRFLTTANMLASLGAAGIGARYMYNRTADRARGDNLAKAQASRARMKGLPTVWLDPNQVAGDVAAAKQQAEQSSNE